MSKELTEKWREGILRGCFYWKLPNGNICIAYTDTMRDIKKVRDSDEVEVLKETPSYVEYKRLQEQIEEANEVIKNMKLCMDDKYDYDCVAEDVDIYLKKCGVK